MCIVTGRGLDDWVIIVLWPVGVDFFSFPQCPGRGTAPTLSAAWPVACLG